MLVCSFVVMYLMALQLFTIAVLSVTTAGVNVDLNMKSCSVAEQCVNGSVNVGLTRVTITSKCCTSELCNTMNVVGMFPSFFTPRANCC